MSSPQSTKAMTIDFFQFDNLVQGRIPFLILHDGIDFNQLYPRSIERDHIDRFSLQVDFSKPWSEQKNRLEDKALNLSLPVLILTQNGLIHEYWITDLEQAGAKNILAATNGWQGFLSNQSLL